jgi:hypothetical protein
MKRMANTLGYKAGNAAPAAKAKVEARRTLADKVYKALRVIASGGASLFRG